MSDNISTRSITKFNGTNFQDWKFQVNTLFMAHGIRDVVAGERTIPTGAGQEVAKKTWIKDNARAMFLMSSSIESEQLESLLVCSTAKEMWDKWSCIHEQKMSPEDSIVRHVAKVQNMAAQLLDTGEAVSDVTIIAKVLASSSSKYATLQTAWDSVDSERQTLENLQERLRGSSVKL
ncbi:uncharacterized protein [Polyergus mexicanus]|uniref:uncharacterized protein n=1 Tax=Polyergus mexicanus TaxID=615972 RepID=UPI0038B66A54